MVALHVCKRFVNFGVQTPYVDRLWSGTRLVGRIRSGVRYSSSLKKFLSYGSKRGFMTWGFCPGGFNSYHSRINYYVLLCGTAAR